MNISQLMELMAVHKIASDDDLVGVSEFEIKNFCKKNQLQLPPSYHDYLAHFGRSAGRLSTWMAFYFDDLQEIKDHFSYTLKKYDLDITLPDNALLISQLGSFFDYMICDGTDDSPIYRIDIRSGQEAFCEKCANDFNHYLLLLITNTREDFKRIQELPLENEEMVFEAELDLGVAS